MPQDKRTRALAYDTRPLPPDALTAEEKDILGGINDLLTQIHKRVKPRQRDHERRSVSPWARLEHDRRNDIIMIDGPRGSGKTSLLLTLLAVWDSSDDVRHDEYRVSDMRSIVRALHPIDFDPLPPDLPLFNWVIQAFEPLVQRVSGQSPCRFMEPHDHDQMEDSLRGDFLKLQHTAALGWTTGMLTQAVGKDMSEFLLWQNEQQGNWQQLPIEWRKFIDRLIKALEKHSYDLMPKGGIIVLPIDDLDLQVSRTRELLLTLRVLRHERIVYLLTGDIEGTDAVLNADFHRDYLRDLSGISDGYRDRIEEITTKLGRKLREKSIPESHTFYLGGASICDAISWKPNTEKTLGGVLDVFWQRWAPDAKETLSEYLANRDPIENKSDLPFRKLQAFYDRWVNDPGSLGIGEFLKVVVERPEEEAISVNSPSISKGPIEFTAPPGIVAPGPQIIGELESPTVAGRISIRWARKLDFFRRRVEALESESFEAASAGETLIHDLAAWDSSRFQIVSGYSKLTEKPFGIVWTQIECPQLQSYIVIPWPLTKPLKSPSAWIKTVRHWENHLNAYLSQASSDYEDVLLTPEGAFLRAWFSFFSTTGPETMVGESVEAQLDLVVTTMQTDEATYIPFTRGYFGFSPALRARIAEALGPSSMKVDREEAIEATLKSARLVKFAPGPPTLGALAFSLESNYEDCTKESIIDELRSLEPNNA